MEEVITLKTPGLLSKEFMRSLGFKISNKGWSFVYEKIKDYSELGYVNLEVCGLYKGMYFSEWDFDKDGNSENHEPRTVVDASYSGPKLEEDFLKLVEIVYGEYILNKMLENKIEELVK